MTTQPAITVAATTRAACLADQHGALQQSLPVAVIPASP
jgi:hypothetical protein